MPRPSEAQRARRSYTIGVGVFTVLAAALLGTGAFGWLEPLGIRPMEQPFADVRTITGAGEALARGLDPQVTNPGDPWSRPMNYPRVWLWLARCGVTPSHTTTVATVFVAALCAGLWLLRRLVSDRTTALLLLLAAFAPTSWLVVERGNNDALMFGLTATAVVLAPRAWSVVLLLAAAALKLYPIAAAAALVTCDRRRSLRRLLPTLALFAGYLIWLGDELGQIQIGAMRAHWLSYGFAAMPAWFAKNSPLPPWLWNTAFAAGLLAVLAGAARLRARVRLAGCDNAAVLGAFRTGATVYLATFLLGRSFDYRLIFLLLTLPQLVHWTRCEVWLLRRAASLQIAVLLLLLWSQTWRHWLQQMVGDPTIGLAIDEWMTWFTWCGLATGVVLSLPGWMVPSTWRRVPVVDGPPAGAAMRSSARPRAVAQKL